MVNLVLKTINSLKLALLLIMVVLLSACNIYSFKHIDKQASYMLPTDQSETNVDKVVRPATEKHPNETGLILLDNNLDAFALRALSAREAGRSLDLQYYIWHDDLTGNLLSYELLRAADRGVRVRLLLDDLTVKDKSAMLAVLNQHPNIEIRMYNPMFNRRHLLLKGAEWVVRGLTTLNRRMHNKAWIVDGQLAIVGGRNIGNEYFDAAPRTNFFDVDMLLVGKAVLDTENIFDLFWNSPVTVPLKELVSLKNKNALAELRETIKNTDESIIQETNIYRDRLRSASSILKPLFNGTHLVYWSADAHVYSDPPEKAYDQNKEKWLINHLYPAWVSAKQELKMVSPYFVPSDGGAELFTSLNKKGVNVEILTNSLAATDVMLVHAGYAPYREPLLEGGVKLYELMPFNVVKKKLLGSSGASLHTKMFMVDRNLSFIGSFNLDPRSTKLNTEMGIFFKHSEATRELLALYAYKVDLKNSYQLSLENGKLQWLDGSVTPNKIWTHEPETGIFKRGVTRIVRWLPIESQL